MSLTLPLRKPKTWPYATSSTGRLRGSLPLGSLGLRVQVYEAVGEARKTYIDLSKRVIGHLNENADEIRISGSCVDLSLFMVGRSPERTKPMVMIVSEDKKARVEAFRLINRSGIMENYPGFDLGHMPLKDEFKNLQPLGGTTGTSSAQAVLSLFNQITDKTGVGLEIFSPASDTRTEGGCLQAQPDVSKGAEHTTQNAAAGGLVFSNGQYYIHTVAHFLRSPSSNSAGPPSPESLDDDDDWDATGLSDFEDDEEDGMDGLVEATSRGSQTPESSASNEDSDDSGSLHSPSVRCSTGSLLPLHDIHDRLQSLESELDGFAPTDVESQEPPLGRDAPPVGTFPTSSTPEMVGIGRVALVSEVHDSAFIRLDVTQPSGWQHAIPLDDLATHIETTAKDTAVQTTTANGGTISGILSGTPSYIRLPRTAKFRQVYTAKLERPLAPGDCGSWVRDASTGKLFGHVVAGSPITGLTIVLPAIDALVYAQGALQHIDLSKSNRCEGTSHSMSDRPAHLELSTHFIGQERYRHDLSTRSSYDLSSFDPLEIEPSEESRPHLPFSRLVVFCIVMNQPIATTLMRPLSTTWNYPLLSRLVPWLAAATLIFTGVFIWIEYALSLPPYRPSERRPARSGGDKNYLEFIYQTRGRRPKRFLNSATLACVLYGLLFVTLGNLSGNAIQFGLCVMKAAAPSTDSREHKTAVISIAIGALTAGVVAGNWRWRASARLNTLLASLKVGFLVAVVFLGLVRHIGSGSSTTYGRALSAGKPLCSALAADPHPAVTASYVCHNRRSTSYIFRNSASLFSPATPLFATRCQHEHNMTALDAALHLLQDTNHTQIVNDPRLRRTFYALMSVFIFGNLLAATFTASRVKQEVAKEGILPGALASATLPPWVAGWQRLWLRDTAVFRWLVDVFLILLVGLTVDLDAEYDARAYTYTGIADVLVGLLLVLGAVCVDMHRRLLRRWGRNTTPGRPPNPTSKRLLDWISVRSWLDMFRRTVDFKLPLVRWSDSARTSLRDSLVAKRSAGVLWRLPYVDIDDTGGYIQRMETVDYSMLAQRFSEGGDEGGSPNAGKD